MSIPHRYRGRGHFLVMEHDRVIKNAGLGWVVFAVLIGVAVIGFTAVLVGSMRNEPGAGVLGWP